VENITKHPAYNAVDPADFPAMLDVNRYGQRSIALDKIISATHDIFGTRWTARRNTPPTTSARAGRAPMDGLKAAHDGLRVD
jgi:hypothetical protein